VISLAQFALLRPWWLIAIPIVIALACLAWRRADGFGRWHEVIDPDLLPVLTHLGRVEIGARDYRPVFMALAASLMAIGLAGPSVRNPGAPVFRNMDAIVILMDLSPSVVEGGGLGDAQAAVARLLDRSGTRPVALIVYTGESFLVSVPTREPQALKSAIAVIDPETMPIGGSRPDRALELAMQTLNDAKSSHADVIIVSDGGGLGPDATLANARDLTELETALTARRGLSATEKARRAILFRDYGLWVFALGAVFLLPIYQQRREI